MSGYRVLFMGTPDFAVASLAALLRSDHEVVAVVTQPDKQKGRGKKLARPPVKELALEAGLPVLQPLKIKTPEFAGQLAAFRADVFVVAAYGRILPPALLALPPLGCINVHGSLLPRHRGAAPIQWAVIAGDPQAGVTIMQMDEGMDTGAMLSRAAIDVGEDETAGSLFAKLARLGAETLITTLDGLRRGEISPEPQDHSQATAAPPLNKEMGRIDWRLPAVELHRLIRGLDPWPSAYTFLDGVRYRLFSPRLVHRQFDGPPGSIVLAEREGITVATGKDALLIGELQPEGKKRLTAEAFLCGHTLAAGSRFTDS